MNTLPRFKSRSFNLGRQYTVALTGGTLHTVLTSLADAERLYRKARLSGLADNAREAYKAILASVEATSNNGSAAEILSAEEA